MRAQSVLAVDEDDELLNGPSAYLSRPIGSTPGSRQILRARISLIFRCLGTAERRSPDRLRHQECRDPSRTSAHPWSCRYRNSALRFMQRRPSLLDSRHRPRPERPAD